MNPAIVEKAARRVGRSPLLPAIGDADRVFERVLSGVGLMVVPWAFAASLVPSLLPRAPWLQGVASGVTVAVGYGLGAAAHALWRYLQIPGLKGRARSIALGLVIGVGMVLVLLSAWKFVGWQNDIRRIMGMESTSPTIWPVVIVVTLLVFTLFVLLARSLIVLARTVASWLGRRLSRRLSITLGVGAVLFLLWGLWTGVIVNGFFAGANAFFAPQDTTGTNSSNRPTAPERSGSPESLSPWEDLGQYGRFFVRGGPDVAELEAVNGPGAKEPIRVFAGLQSADTVQGRADLVLEELKRTGAFDREVLVVATTTGMGYLDHRGTDPLEYLWNGDTAIAGVQYSYLPSWISMLADQDAVASTSRVVFETVHQYWSTLPSNDRPDLYLYGLSLGSRGVESVLSSISIVNAPVNGALMSGPPFVNPLHARLQAERDPGSPASLPIYEDGRTVRFANSEGGLERGGARWGPTRLVYLQYASDPTVFYSPNLAFREPDWLKEGQRGPDVAPTMEWFPFVTMWQVLLDMPAGTAVPAGFGHMYSSQDNLDSWAALTQPPGWGPGMRERLSTALPSD